MAAFTNVGNVKLVKVGALVSKLVTPKKSVDELPARSVTLAITDKSAPSSMFDKSIVPEKALFWTMAVCLTPATLIVTLWPFSTSVVRPLNGAACAIAALIGLGNMSDVMLGW